MNIDNTNISYEDKAQIMTIRDQLASNALIGLLSAWQPSECIDEVSIKYVCIDAYKFADAMLSARAK